MPTPEKPFDRLLLTGAAGGLGRVLRPQLRDWAHAVRISDRDDCGVAEPGEELVRCALFTPRVDHSIVYGVSDNAVRWWDNARAAHLGFHATDSSHAFADRFPPAGPQDASKPEYVYQGGPWVLSTPMPAPGKEPQ